MTIGSNYTIKLNSIEASTATSFSLCPAAEQAVQLTFNSTKNYSSVFAVEGPTTYFSELLNSPFQHFDYTNSPV